MGKLVNLLSVITFGCCAERVPKPPIYHILMSKNSILIPFIFHEMHELYLDSSMENQIKYVYEMFGNSYFE